ncbi:1109_t:CDS:2 [Funneliformis geosporum]|uniref:1109_t:CDS:1 n=1 Tax=Funneliformis geosporum TaxID=1117311 RepID=A0A9W4SP38_9GLOM|nr:1109_t:CDS:2 [Funneliformis geosporum]
MLCLILRELNYTDYAQILKWKKKLEILHGIAKNLEKIHELNYVHGDLHSGNVLIFNEESKITDLGLARSTSDKSNLNASGVLQYMAPEILNKKPYTTASDIYSFGIIMTEITTRTISYENECHISLALATLALAICNGLRPIVAKGTPKCYVDKVNQCLDANPAKRPSAKELCNIINSWQNISFQEFNEADATTSHTPECFQWFVCNSFNVSHRSKQRDITNFTGFQVEDSKLMNLSVHSVPD